MAAGGGGRRRRRSAAGSGQTHLDERVGLDLLLRHCTPEEVVYHGLVDQRLCRHGGLWHFAGAAPDCPAIAHTMYKSDWAEARGSAGGAACWGGSGRVKLQAKAGRLGGQLHPKTPRSVW